MVTDSLGGMAEKLDRLLHNWMNPDLDNYPDQVAECRDDIESIRETLGVMEEILKHDLYCSAGRS
jgi:hypothetical protein